MANNETKIDSKKFGGVQGYQNGLMEVVLTLRKNIFRNLKVASLAIVKSINEDNVIVETIPRLDKEDVKTLKCKTIMYRDITKINYDYSRGDSGGSSSGSTNAIEYGWKPLSSLLVAGDLVLVVFLDRDSEQAYKQVKMNQKPSTLQQNSDLHSENFGIVVDVVYKKEQNKED